MNGEKTGFVELAGLGKARVGFEAKPIRVWTCCISWLLVMGLRWVLFSSALRKVWVWGRT